MSNRDNAQQSLPFVKLFTDGACRGNPGPGGWAFILKHPASGLKKSRTAARPKRPTTAWSCLRVIEGLTALKSPSQVEVVTDSVYVAKGAQEWMPNWKRNGWKRKEKGRLKPVLNEELWKRIDELLAEHDVRFTVGERPFRPPRERTLPTNSPSRPPSSF